MTIHPGWSTGDEDTIVDVLRRVVEARPDDVFLDFTGETITYGQFWERTLALANGLIELGVAPGDTVASLLDNNLDSVVTWMAINAAGAVSVPVNTAYKGEFLRNQLDDSGAGVVVAESDYAARIGSVSAGLPNLRAVLHRGPTPEALPSTITVEQLSNAYSSSTADPGLTVRPGSLPMLIYTAGTTGASKGCMVSHNFACNLARQSIAATTRRPDEVLWTSNPLFHMNATAAAILPTAMLGSRLALFPRFSVSRFWADIERSGASIVSVLGAMIPLLAQADDSPEMLRCHGQIRVASGSPFTPDLVRIWKERFGVRHVNNPGYGITEACMVVTAPADADAPLGSSGRRNDDFDVRIVDDDDHEVGSGVVGEVVVRPLKPHVMFEGYWKRPEATQAIMRNMWLHTGDLGSFDDDGWFYFRDRKKDYLRRRGENISSFEMESTFLRHPEVVEVAVHAVLSEMTEDDVKVTAVRREGSTLSEVELCTWSVDQLPYFAVPRYVEFVAELPKNPVGRVLKYQLRDAGVTAGTWDREASDVQIAKR